jgi:hypothetical protein
MPRFHRRERLKKRREAPDCSFWDHFAPDGEIRGNVHDRGVVEITASSVDSTGYVLQNGADLGSYSELCSKTKPDKCICGDFKVLRIESTHYTLRRSSKGPNWSHLKISAVEDSDGHASWTEIDRRGNNSDLNDKSAVKMFGVARSGSFRRIRLRQTGRNHRGSNQLVLIAFEVFRAVAGLQETVQGNTFFVISDLPAPTAPFLRRTGCALPNCVNCCVKSPSPRASLFCCPDVRQFLP